MSDYHTYLMADHLYDRLIARLVNGEANIFTHRAAIRGFYFKEYMLAKATNSVRLLATQRKYLEASASWWCPRCMKPIEPEVMQELLHSGTVIKQCEQCWDKEEAEDNRPARQPVSL